MRRGSSSVPSPSTVSGYSAPLGSEMDIPRAANTEASPSDTVKVMVGNSMPSVRINPSGSSGMNTYVPAASPSYSGAEAHVTGRATEISSMSPPASSASEGDATDPLSASPESSRGSSSKAASRNVAVRVSGNPKSLSPVPKGTFRNAMSNPKDSKAVISPFAPIGNALVSANAETGIIPTTMMTDSTIAVIRFFVLCLLIPFPPLHILKTHLFCSNT